MLNSLRQSVLGAFVQRSFLSHFCLEEKIDPKYDEDIDHCKHLVGSGLNWIDIHERGLSTITLENRHVFGNMYGRAKTSTNYADFLKPNCSLFMDQPMLKRFIGRVGTTNWRENDDFEFYRHGLVGTVYCRNDDYRINVFSDHMLSPDNKYLRAQTMLLIPDVAGLFERNLLIERDLAKAVSSEIRLNTRYLIDYSKILRYWVV